MNRRALLAGTPSSAFAALLPACATQAIAPRAPVAARIPTRIEQLGRVRVDEYAWLKDPNWLAVWHDPRRLSANFRSHLEAENTYAALVLADAEADRRALLAEMTSRAGVEVDAPPVADGGWAYAQRHAVGASHPAYVRQPTQGGGEQILLDVQARAEGKGFFHIGAATHSPDHKLFAWSEDDAGAERFRLFVRDLDTGEVLPTLTEEAFGDFAFSADSRFVFWTWRSANSRPTRIYRTPVRGGENALVYEETDPGMYMQIGRSSSGEYVLIRILNADTSEIRLISAAAVEAAPRIVAPRTTGHFYDLDHGGDRFVIRTNADGAIDFKLMTTSEADLGRSRWRDLVPYEPGRVIVAMRAFATHLVRVERVDAKLEVVIRDRAGGERRMAFPEAAYLVSIDDRAAFDADRVRLLYQSPRSPPRWIDVAFASEESRVAADQAPPGYDPDVYVIRRLDAPSSGGVTVPIALLMRRDTPIDGSAPLLLHGYGSYGYTTEDEFVLANLCLADRGWMVATAHVRGGGERGRAWYQAARQTRKHNSFIDFVACAEYLAASGYAHPRKIVSYGFSAGGLLVAASLNRRPDMFAGVIARAPYVDCLNTMSDAEHPLVPLARPDWGDPLADPAAYDYIASYSPYENVRPQAYPPVFATTAVSDDRVGYWEPAKWIANLRAQTTSRSPVLLRTNMAAGHSGASGRLGAFEEMSGFYAFALWAVRQ